MSLLVGLQHREQLGAVLAHNLEGLIGAVQAAMTAREQGQNMTLLLGLQDPEQLDPIVRDELDQVFAAIQVAFNRRDVLKSIQRGTITMAGGTQTATYPLPVAVNPNNTVVTWLGQSANSTDSDNALMRVELTNSTTVTAYRGQLNDNGGTVAFEVREYHPGVLKSAVQRGTIRLNAVTSNTATITAVDSGRSALAHLGVYSASGDAGNEPATHIRLAFTTSGTNVLSTMITATRENATGDVTVGYEVREYY